MDVKNFKNLHAQFFTKFNNIWWKMPSMNGPTNYHVSISHNHTDFKYQCIDEENLV